MAGIDICHRERSTDSVLFASEAFTFSISTLPDLFTVVYRLHRDKILFLLSVAARFGAIKLAAYSNATAPSQSLHLDAKKDNTAGHDDHAGHTWSGAGTHDQREQKTKALPPLPSGIALELFYSNSSDSPYTCPMPDKLTELWPPAQKKGQKDTAFTFLDFKAIVTYLLEAVRAGKKITSTGYR